MPRVVRQYVVAGRVQGVGFRWFVREYARSAGLTGWVRNAANGTVVVVAAGTLEQLERLELKLREGPFGAHVRQVDVADLRDNGAAVDASGEQVATAETDPFTVVRH